VGPTSRTGAGRATSSLAGTSFGIDEDAKMSTAWGRTGCLPAVVDGADALASSCVESVGLMLEAAIAGTESGAPAGAGLPIMGAPMEEDLVSGCSVEKIPRMMALDYLHARD
jgi:hypothetical protein